MRLNMHFTSWQNKATAVWLFVIFVVGILLAMMWWQDKIHIQTNIFRLLPQFTENETILTSHDQVSDHLNNKVFIMLQAQDQDRLELATAQLLQQAQQSGLWQPIQPTLDVEKFAATLFQYRTGLLSQQDRQFLLRQDTSALLEQSMLQLLSPAMPINAEMLKQDPLLLFPRYLMEKSQGHQQAIGLEQGWATRHDTLDGQQEQISRLIILNVAQSPYNIEYQEQAQQWFEQMKTDLTQYQVKTTFTGTLLFASFGTQSARQEISTIGIGSSIGLVLLVLFGFRSVRPLLTEFIAVSTGCLMAFVVTHWIFGEIHLMTLVFGASLIGVCVDFSFYFMAMQSTQRGRDGFMVLKPLLPGLFVGLMTTIIAYFFLSFTPFPAFKQISIFSMLGLFSAWITSILLLPRLPALNAQPALKRLHFLGEIRLKVVNYPRRRGMIIVLVTLFSVIGLSQIKFNDDIRNLQSTNAALKKNDQTIRQAFGQNQGNDYFVVSASTPAQLQQAEQQLLDELEQLQVAGKVDRVQSIAQWFNPQQIAENINLLRAIPKADLVDYAVVMGLAVDDVLNWQAQLTQQPALTMQHMQQHPLAQLALSPTSHVVLVQGIHDAKALADVQNQNVFFMQPVQTLSTQFALHRQQAQWLLLAAIVALAVILALLYGWRSVLDLMLPVCLALSSTFAIQAFLGIELNLFSIMATFLILGIGVDYAIFYRHAQQHDFVVAMALFLCMMSTLLGFGLLALSHTYAIFCFGLTVLCGVILSFIFATCFTRTEHSS